jgi:uncharacterized membrane protein SirB2
MIEFYSDIRSVHITAALVSGGLFFLRGVLLLAGVLWARAAPLRYLAYTIDTVLLTAALMLATILQQYPFVHAWLTVKMLLVIVYIAAGLVVFREGLTRGAFLTCWLGGLAVYGFTLSVARAHDPLGFLGNLVH